MVILIIIFTYTSMQTKPSDSEHPIYNTILPKSQVIPSGRGTGHMGGKSIVQTPIHTDTTMSIKEEETVEQILQQTLQLGSSRRQYTSNQDSALQHHVSYPHCLTTDDTIYQLDEDIDRLLRQSEIKISEEYENLAKDQFARNRIGISINDEHDRLKEIFDRMDAANSEISKEDNQNKSTLTEDENSKKSQPFNLDLTSLKHRSLANVPVSQKQNSRPRSQSTSIVSFEEHPYEDEQDSEDSNESKASEVAKAKPEVQMSCNKVASRLDIFEKEYILQPKQQSLQILELDQKYPKINLSSMYRHQYPIFKFSESSTTKYIRYLKKSMNAIQCAVSFNATNDVKWTILAIHQLIYVFVGEDWKEPIIVNPCRSQKLEGTRIEGMWLSKTETHLSVSLGTEILVYHIKKEANNLVLVKSLSSNNDLNRPLQHVTQVLVYCDNPIKLAYLDAPSVGLIACEQIMLFSRVTERQLEHHLADVLDLDVLLIDSGSSADVPSPEGKFKFSLNKKLNSLGSKPNVGYVAICSRRELQIHKIEPNMPVLMYSELLHEEIEKGISVRWRFHQEMQARPQLLVCYNTNIYIYKLMEQAQNGNDGVYLQLHLVYQNHYDILQMEIISNLHLLLLSNSNIIVVAIPLIPSTDLSHFTQTRLRKSSGCGHEIFESAIVFITNEKDCRILYASKDEVIYHSNNTEVLRLATLKPLQSYIDELMLHHGHFREAFTLLILVNKGVNYSFKFTYTKQSLAHSIFSAVQCTISSLRTTMSENIIEYRLGWVCQLLVETHNQPMIWSTVYNRLKQKQKDREKQWTYTQCPHQPDHPKTKDRNSFGDNLAHTYSLDLFDSLGVEHGDETRKRKIESRHSLSLQQTSSSQLLGKHPKNLEWILFDILQVFILKSQIDSIPEHIFLQFIAYECQKKQDTVVQKAIVQNKSAYDGAKLLSLLQNKERNYLQLYLFSRAIICDEPDFYTPFIKVFASFKRQIDGVEKGSKDKNLQEMLEKKKNAGYLCLWFLNKCLNFQKIPSGIMPLNQKLVIIHTMCVQLLEPTLTQRLFELDHCAFLQTFLLMFTGGELSFLLEENNQALVQRYRQYYPSVYQQIMATPQCESQRALSRISEGPQIEEIMDKSFKQLILLHIGKTIPVINNDKALWAEFQASAFFHNKTEICLSFEATVDILIILFESKFDGYRLHVPCKHSSRPSVQELKLSLIDYIKPVLIQRKDRFYINKLTSFNDKHVSYHLYRIDQNYKQALEHFISTKQPKELIPFIHSILSDIGQNDKPSKERKLVEVKSFLVKNIGTLFNIDKFEALNIFYSIGETSQTIYKLIEESMGNKLNFLTAVLKKFELEDFQMKQKLQLEHLSEVCLLKDKQMLEYLDEFYYPLDSAIIVCEQKGNLLAKAIFEERCGRITDAFMSYERIMKNIIQSNSSASKQSEKSVKKKVHKYTEQCLRLCKQYAYDPNSSPESNFWLRIITFINGFIKSNSQHKVFLKVEFEKVLQHILEEMFQFLPTTILTDFFIGRGHKLELSMAKQFAIYQNLFILAKFDISMAKKVVEVCKIDIKETRKEALSKRKNGIVSSGCCDFCKKALIEEAHCHVYYCRHSFHKICHDDVYKCLTCYFESDNSLVKMNIFGSQLQRYGEELKQQNKGGDGKCAGNQKRPKSMENVHVIVESAQLAKQESVKKKFKLFDYAEQKWNDHFYESVAHYNEKQKEKQISERNAQKLEQFEDDYLKYSRTNGLEVKKKEAQKVSP